MNDLRFAVRELLKNPGFSALIILTLAVGIGANTAIFSVVNGVLLRPLPFADPDHLVTVWERNPTQGYDANMPAPANYLSWKKETKSFAQLAIFNPGLNFALTGKGEPRRISGAAVSANLFSTLGLSPVLGRGFSEQDEHEARTDIVIISDALRRQLFPSDQNPIGQTLELEGITRTVVGVMSPQFRFPGGTGVIQKVLVNDPADFWVPLIYPREFWAQHSVHFLQVLGRLREGSTIEQAEAELSLLQGHLAKERAGEFLGTSVKLIPLREQGVADVRRGILALTGAVGCILLVACANIANLLLARTLLRQREFAVRLALGARPLAVLRQFSIESLVLCCAGGVAGAVLADWGTRILRLFLSERMRAATPGLEDLSPDIRVLLFTGVISAVCALFFTIVPSPQISGVLLGISLNAANRGTTAAASTRRLRNGFVIAQIACAMVLLAAAALMVQSFVHLVRTPLGFQPQKLLAIRLTLPETKYQKAAQRVAFFQEGVDRIQTLPGVQSAGMSLIAPFGGGGKNYSFSIQGRAPEPAGKFLTADLRPMTAGYFRTLGVPLVKGRAFDERDHESGARVVLVNETFVQRYFNNEDPIGRQLNTAGGETREIIGVVRDFKHLGIEHRPNPQIYGPLAQMPYFNFGTILVRTTGDPIALGPGIRRELAAIDQNLPIDRIETMETLLGTVISQPRMRSWLFAVFGSVAILLSVLGIYGVLSESVQQRAHEIGIRVAIGARSSDIWELVLRQGGKLIAFGIVVGLFATFATTRLLGTLLYGIEPDDLTTVLLACLGISTVSVLACCLPARRAARIQPVEALRYE
jgi:putative ABC transport system permease protein